MGSLSIKVNEKSAKKFILLCILILKMV